MSEDLFKLPCVQCENPMKWCGTGTSWSGAYEISTFRFECQNACLTSAEVEYKTFIPVDLG